MLRYSDIFNTITFGLELNNGPFELVLLFTQKVNR